MSRQSIQDTKQLFKGDDAGLDDRQIVMTHSSAHPINRGLGGHSIILRSHEPGQDVFAKKLSAENLLRGVIDDMVQLARQASETGVAPALLEADADQGLLFFEALPNSWNFGTAKAFRNPDLVAKAINAIKTLQGGERLSKQVTLIDRIRDLKHELDEISGKVTTKVYPEFYHLMSDWTDRIENAIKASGFDPVPCKGENNLSDFMIGPGGEVQLVDFDLATNGDPYSDLGVFANEVCRSDDDIHSLLESYSSAPHRAEIARIKAYMVVSAFHLGLWGLVSQLRAPETEIEFFKYGQNQFLRCRAAISRWDLAHDLGIL